MNGEEAVLETLRRPPDVEELLERLASETMGLMIHRTIEGDWYVFHSAKNPRKRGETRKAKGPDLWVVLASLDTSESVPGIGPRPPARPLETTIAPAPLGG